MKNIRTGPTRVTARELSTSPRRVLRAAARGPVVIIQEGRAAGVLLSPAEYQRLVDVAPLRSAIDEGIAAADAGDVITTAALRPRLGLSRS